MKFCNDIKENILGKISGIACPICYEKIYIGAVSEKEQKPALFCSNCKLRISISLVITEFPN